MRLRCFLISLALIVGASFSAQAQWIPVVAKQKELTYRIQPDGSQVLVRQRIGTYLRSSSGSVMKTLVLLENNKPQGKGEALFIDSKTGNTYRVFHDAQRAMLVQRRQSPLQPMKPNYKQEDIVGHEVVNGLECVGVKLKGANGIAWISILYDLTVKLDFRLGEGRVVEETYDIQEAEPDPAIFAIPKSYAIQSDL